MSLLVGILCYIGTFILLGVAAYYAKWILAAISILTGDKEALKDYGDLCDPTLPPPKDDWHQRRHWQDQNWRNWGEGNMN